MSPYRMRPLLLFTTAVLLVWCSVNVIAVSSTSTFASAAAAVSSARTDRVCVLGAGPSGLYAAAELEKLGYPVTVLEKEAVVGGKAHTVQYQGDAFDMGALLVTTHKRVLQSLMDRFHFVVKDMPAWTFLDFSQARFQESQAAYMSTLSGAERLRLVQQLATFEMMHVYWSALLNEMRPGHRTDLPAEQLAELALPIDQFLHKYGLDELLGMFAVTSTGFGYASTKLQAMEYFWKNVRPARPSLKLQSALFGVNQTYLWLMRDGMGALFRSLAATLHDVRTAVDVLSADRSSAGVTLTFVNTSAPSAGKQSLQCAKLIVAFAQQASKMTFLNLDAAELNVFSRVIVNPLVTGLAEVQGPNTIGFLLLNESSARGRLADVPILDEGTVFSFGKSGSNSSGAVFYVLFPTGSNATAEDGQRAMQRKVGHLLRPASPQLFFKRWEYFPRFAPADIAANIYKRLEDLQGYRSTYYTGALLNFEMVEDVLEYSERLVCKYFQSWPWYLQLVPIDFRCDKDVGIAM